MVHKHAQGFSSTCDWCALDAALFAVASDVGIANAKRYLVGLIEEMERIGNAPNTDNKLVEGIVLTVRYGDGPMVSAEEAAELLAIKVKTDLDDTGAFDDVTVDGSVRYA